MKRASLLIALAAAFAPAPSHALDHPVVVAGFQYTPGYCATADPLNLVGGTACTPAAPPILRRGDALAFTNLDPEPFVHTVTRVSGGGFWTSISLNGTGSTGRLVISSSFASGTYVYRCNVHPGMRGQFVVA